MVENRRIAAVHRSPCRIPGPKRGRCAALVAVDRRQGRRGSKSGVAIVRLAARHLDKTLPSHEEEKNRTRSVKRRSIGAATPNEAEGRDGPTVSRCHRWKAPHHGAPGLGAGL